MDKVVVVVAAAWHQQKLTWAMKKVLVDDGGIMLPSYMGIIYDKPL